MLLKMENITKVYGNVVANESVSLHLDEGEVLAIVGENGAGKTTIMKILYGLEKPTNGEIYLKGQKVNFKNPHDAISKGIGMVQQHFMLFKEFSVAENIVYANEPHKMGIFFDRKKANNLVRELSDKYGLDINPLAIIDDCPVGLQQRVEILKVLYQDARIIIFDEPSAVLAPREVKSLLETIRKLASMGKSIIIITHKLQEVLDVADRVVVMRHGKKVDEMDIKDASIENMSYKMVGHHIEKRKIKQHVTGDTVLRIKDLNYYDEAGKYCVKDLSLHVDSGEIVGIAGVSGNGQSELIQCVLGMLSAQSGEIILNGSNITSSSVNVIRGKGCSCIPEDRYKYGCAAQATLMQTVLLANQRKKRFCEKGILKNKSIVDFATDLFDDFNVTYDSIKQKACELSGGNLQKAIVAREFMHGSKLLIAAEPTRGVDIGSINFIHDKLIEKCEKGDGILLVSSELSEILELADRIYVMYSGRIVGELARTEANAEKIGMLMMGGSVKSA